MIVGVEGLLLLLWIMMKMKLVCWSSLMASHWPLFPSSVRLLLSSFIHSFIHSSGQLEWHHRHVDRICVGKGMCGWGCHWLDAVNISSWQILFFSFHFFSFLFLFLSLPCLVRALWVRLPFSLSFILSFFLSFSWLTVEQQNESENGHSTAQQQVSSHITHTETSFIHSFPFIQLIVSLLSSSLSTLLLLVGCSIRLSVCVSVPPPLLLICDYLWFLFLVAPSSLSSRSWSILSLCHSFHSSNSQRRGKR